MWADVRRVAVARITDAGNQPVGEIAVTDGKITLGVAANEALALTPVTAGA